MKKLSLKEQISLIRRGAVEIIREDELRKKIEKSIKTGKSLVIKAGFDPTAPDIHLGHTVLLRKLRHFQECGHTVNFLIGDATALVGDPSGQSQMRKMMTWEGVLENARTYEIQVKKDLDVKRRFKRVHNSQWFGKRGEKKFGFEDFVDLAQKYTIARLLERDDFKKRWDDKKPISFLELFYPLMQGYDSYVMNADVEIGGTDQKFNMLVGRDLQQAYGKVPQVVITMPLLEGTDGVNKMSKSLGNYIGISEKPRDVFGKIMSISDGLMLRYFELLTDEPLDKIKREINSGELHPKTVKLNLAKLIVTRYYGKETAEKECRAFDEVFKGKGLPSDMPEVVAGKSAENILLLIKRTGLVASSSEAKRLLTQGAVSVNGEKVRDLNKIIKIGDEGCIIKIGKRRFAKVVNK